MHLERLLDPIEIRILGCLLEKQQTTPEVYPLTLNALTTACNQKTNRQPVMQLEESEIEAALERLQEIGLVWRVHGGRVIRWDHKLGAAWSLHPPRKALMTLLLLRGPQTAGELRSRGERMDSYTSIDLVEGILREMAEGDDALVEEVPRRPGQKETRWRHRVGESGGEPEPQIAAPAESLTARVERLERSVDELTRELRKLMEQLGD
ncbi:MAG TPA: YceH family protein [Thermoanaerobaculia bacterium]|nr:YceH family protein [Thermoanaerobaculia bacterium]